MINDKIKNNKKLVLILNALIIIFSISLVPKTFQNDTYYTIRIGETISQYGIDMQDHYSWHNDLEYTYPHWLYDYITYLIYNKFGFIGIYAATCMLSSILGLTLYHIAKKITKTNLISFCISCAFMRFLIPFITARAQLVTFILFALEVYCIESYLKSNKKKYIIYLLIIPILIANMHVAVFPFYFVIYLPYIAEYFIYNMLFNLSTNKKYKKKIKKNILSIDKKIEKDVNNKEILIKQKEELSSKLNNLEKNKENQIEEFNYKRDNLTKIKIENNKNIPKLIIIMIIAMFSGLFTPLGNTPYTYLIKTMMGNTTSYIQEHLPIVFANYSDALMYFGWIILLLTFTKSKIKLSDLFMLLGLMLLTILSVRQFSMLIILSLFLCVRIIKSIIMNYNKDGVAIVEEKLSSKKSMILIIILICIISGIYICNKFNDNYVDETVYPIEACEYILENLDVDKIKIFNEYEYGSYMLFNNIPVFIDSRADLYTPEFNDYKYDVFTDYMNISNIIVNYKEEFEKYEITHVILNKDSKLLNVLVNDIDYFEIYNDDNFVIFEIINYKE